MRIRHFLLLLCASALTLGVGPCPTKVTGGGMMDGASGRDTITVNADSCGDTVSGEFEYVAHESLVKMHGQPIQATQCVVTGVDANGNPITTCPQCQMFVGLVSPGTLFGGGAADSQFIVDYRSTNPALPGTGQALACVSDNGQGGGSRDTAYVQVLSGPFAGYTNFGSV